jgi:hypothetical protein
MPLLGSTQALKEARKGEPSELNTTNRECNGAISQQFAVPGAWKFVLVQFMHTDKNEPTPILPLAVGSRWR